jgi:hypothetical protein
MVSVPGGKLAIFSLLPYQSIKGKAWAQCDVLYNMSFFRHENFLDEFTLPNSLLLIYL